MSIEVDGHGETGVEGESSPLMSVPPVDFFGAISERSVDSAVSWDDKVDSGSSERGTEGSKGFFDLRLKWTDSLRHKAADSYHGNAYPAAFLIRDAILGTGADMTGVVRAAGAYDFNPHSDENHPLVNQISLVCRWLLAREIVYNITHIASWVLVLVSFFEPPSWCRNYTTASGDVLGCEALLSARGPPAFGDEEDVQYYPNTGTALLTVDQSLVIDW
eukprot:CAMPEP_0113532676 /NCGR_PEP_ID=MMETSP0015_2-20120614/4191_1 /TAXON_ID=2838 /ORGANISM="Odontella" /LENGTH=217 /DNA_ID=CAMNT_0000431663 /DNA_START=138 /DNA_END=788 /DNA_ORIENTATION=+ /assembly_acc=CAM_ASM_000160